jgi:hypothetical protein
MNEPKIATHTPGPWHVRVNHGKVSIEYHNGIGLVELADIAAPNGLAVAEADACLISTAPKLLVACKVILDILRESREGEEPTPIEDHLQEIIDEALGFPGR